MIIYRLILVCVLTCLFSAGLYAADKVSFKADDGLRIYATYFAAEKSKAPIIICFHMAGSNKGEYGAIAPLLIVKGFNVLSVDLRSGGPAFGQINETAKQLKKPADIGAALPDMRAAVTWARRHNPKSKIILWGSSYSASLAIVLATEDKRVSAVLAFSPGEYFQEGIVAAAAAKISVPLFVTSSKSEVDSVQAIYDAATAQKTQFTPKRAGRHGSSALLLSATETAEYWKAVDEFLFALK